MSVKVLLQEVRKSKGLSQNDLARLTHMSPQNIQKIEQGESKSMTFKTLGKFCRVLECQPGDLLVYEEEELGMEKKNVSIEGVKTKASKKECLSLKANDLIPQFAI